MKKLLVLLILLSSALMSFSQKTEDGIWSIDGFNETKAKVYLSRNSIEPLEGIWQSSDGFKYFIGRDTKDGVSLQDQFILVILESSYDIWPPSFIRAYITRGTRRSAFSMKYFDVSSSGSVVSQNIFLLLDNFSHMYFTKLNGQKVMLYKLYPRQLDESGKAELSYDEKLSMSSELLMSAKKNLDQGNVEMAYKEVCMSVELYPIPLAHYLKASLAYFYFRDYKSAEASFDYCAQNDFQALESKSYLANIYFFQNKYEKSLKYCDEVIGSLKDEDQKYIKMLELRASVKSALGDEQGQCRDLKLAVKYEGKVDYNYAYIYNALSSVSVYHNNLNDASFYIAKSLKYDRFSVASLDLAAKISYLLGNYEKCLQLANMAVTNARFHQNSDDGFLWDSYFNRGMAKKQLGDYAGAYGDLKKSAALGYEEAEKEVNKMNFKIDFSDDGTFSKTVFPSGMNTNCYDAKLTKVVSTDEYTALYITFDAGYSDKSFSIQPDAYIQNRSDKIKLPLAAVDGCAIEPQVTEIKAKQKKQFVLYFAPLPKKTQSFNFCEPNNSSKDMSFWKINNIKF